MMNLEFPYAIGFTYFEEYDEWRMPTIEGDLILWEKPGRRGFWVLSYHDSEDYLHQITNGYSNDIINGIKAFQRDIKILELIGE